LLTFTIAEGYPRSQHHSFTLFQMQLTSKDANMVVDFYPVKFLDGSLSTRYILKIVTFMGQSQSKSYINKKDFDREVDSRVEGYGYEVTDMHTTPQFFNSALSLAC